MRILYEPVHPQVPVSHLGNASSTLYGLVMNEKSMDLEFSQIQQYSPRILAVDDDEDSLLLMTHILDSMGCTFITATNGKVVLSLAQEYQPDLIMLDIMLPEVDGVELMGLLKQDPLTDKIPIIAVTALALPEERKRIENAGCDAYISKPYSINEIKKLIYKHFKRNFSPPPNFNLQTQNCVAGIQRWQSPLFGPYQSSYC